MWRGWPVVSVERHVVGKECLADDQDVDLWHRVAPHEHGIVLKIGRSLGIISRLVGSLECQQEIVSAVNGENVVLNAEAFVLKTIDAKQDESNNQQRPTNDALVVTEGLAQGGPVANRNNAQCNACAIDHNNKDDRRQQL